MIAILEACAGALLVTALLTVWRRSESGAVRVLAAQGAALAVLVAVIGAHHHDRWTVAVVALVVAVKIVALPLLLARALRSSRSADGDTEPDTDRPLINPTATLVLAAALSVGAYAAIWPLVSDSPDEAIRLTPVGVAVILIGLLAMSTRRKAITMLVGFLVLDNGIAAVAFFSSGGVPLLVEFAATFDVLLVMVILGVFTVRLRDEFGDTDITRLNRLHD
ncbi:hypothetical protein ACWDTI_16050 [Gordonia sp. NPDC003424]